MLLFQKSFILICNLFIVDNFYFSSIDFTAVSLFLLQAFMIIFIKIHNAVRITATITHPRPNE